jgi:outer membrane protein assembly factor BamA
LNSYLAKYIHSLGAFGLVVLLFHGFSIIAQPGFTRPPSGSLFIRIDSILISGNKITRDNIILRELMFQEGQYVNTQSLDSLLEKSRENLLNTLLFNFVDIGKSYLPDDSSFVNISIEVTERWYIWPTPILKISDRNFNVWWQTKDFSRLSYGFYIDWRNFRGRKESFIVRFQWGYDRIVELNYLIPYLDKNKIYGLGFAFGHSSQNEAAVRTQYNKQEFFDDPLDYARQDNYAYGQFLIRRGFYNTHFFQLGYDHHNFSDSLINENIHFTVDSASRVQYFSLHYQYKSDHRDFKSYPLKGHYFDLEVIKDGLWIFQENSLNTFYIRSAFRKYWKLDNRLYLASGVSGQVSMGLQPYFSLRGIGYDRDIIRSYEYYLVDAQHFAVFKNNLKFALIPQTERQFNFINSEKFSKIFYALYLNIFFDAGLGIYNQDFGKETNDLQNSLLLGYGTGLDFVTYYDVVMRLEFSINFLNETGVFLHFRAPI